ncbi:hypothetical protein BS78_03G228900 [Paspalum vaginatum]|nr:hypothetical protein BS78_03G228900 [Paspalum vaginatum]
MGPCFPGGTNTRALAMVAYDPAAAETRALQQQQEEASTSSSSSTNAAALLLDAASALLGLFGGGDDSEPEPEPTNAVPISAVAAAELPRPPMPPPPVEGKHEPPCLRAHFLARLGAGLLRPDLPVHFIADKVITATDLDPQQNRFRIPREGAMRRLRELLTDDELDAANLRLIPPRAPRPPKTQQRTAGGGIKKPKAKGKKHGGLLVNLVDLVTGAVKRLLLSRWDSNYATVIKGEGYLDFIRDCGYEVKEVVEIWAFVQRRLRIFGNDIFPGSVLHLLIVRKSQDRCRYCPLPSAPAANPPIVTS